MYYATAALVGSNLYDLLMKIMSSDVMRSLFSYLIRQVLIRVGL
jgi:hypothetical protein